MTTVHGGCKGRIGGWSVCTDAKSNTSANEVVSSKMKISLSVNKAHMKKFIWTFEFELSWQK